MKQTLIFLMIFNCCLTYGQQLLTPYNGTLSAAAQQTLQNYQANPELTYIGAYEMSSNVLFNNNINVNFGSYSFQFFLDRKSELAMRKIWQGSSIMGDKITIIYKGKIGNIDIQESSLQKFQIYNI